MSPHETHCPTAAVTSTAKISRSGPASALPSSYSPAISASVMSASSWAQPLRLHPTRVVPEADQHGGHDLHERSRAAHEACWLHVRGEAFRVEIVDLDPPRRHRPTLRRGPRKYVRDVYAGRRVPQLGSVVEVAGRTNGIHEAESRLAVRYPAGSDHRHQRHDSGAAGDQQDRSGIGRPPDEPPANWTADLQRIT